ncbi:MAG: nucleoside deaminase [Tissierellia bacterium]|nr:nucleoside deaminase [Tissierellia bacterium]
MWRNLEKPWQIAFEMAWEAYISGTVPIGAVLINDKGDIISTGRNRIFDKEASTPLAGTNMAHAEMDALLGLKAKEHPDIRKYILYTSMEPCPMCFGTAVMMNIRNIYFAARDGFAGATALNDKLDYIRGKNIVIKQGNEEMEAFQLILQSAYEYGRKHLRMEELLNKWRKINEKSIEYGKHLYESRYFSKAIRENKHIGQIYDEVIVGGYRSWIK